MSDAAEQIRQAQEYKEEGNGLHAQGNYKRALGAYHKVFCFVNGLQHPVTTTTTDVPITSSAVIPVDKVEDVKKIKQSTRLNMAACYLKLHEYQKCVDACSMALELAPHPKAYFRRGKALIELRHFVNAKHDLEEALKLTPEDTSVRAELRRCRALAAHGDEQERNTCAKMISECPADPRVKAAKETRHAQDGLVVEDADATCEELAPNSRGDDALPPPNAEQSVPKPSPVVSEIPGIVAAGKLDSVSAASGGAALTVTGSAEAGAPVVFGEASQQQLLPPQDALPVEEAKQSPSETATHPASGVPGPLGDLGSPDIATTTLSSPAAPLERPTSSEILDEAPKLDITVKQLSYAWQQTDEEVKVYIPFDQSSELEKGVDESRVKVEFGEWSILLVIESQCGQAPLGLRLGDFHRRLAPELCKCTVRGSRITLKLVKRVKEHWWNILQHAPLNND